MAPRSWFPLVPSNKGIWVSPPGDWSGLLTRKATLHTTQSCLLKGGLLSWSPYPWIQVLPCVKILPITFWRCFLFGKNCLELKCKTIHQSKEFTKGYLIKMFTFLILSAAAWGCLITGGNSVRNPFNWLWILGLIVRAPYSNFGEACQHGTMLWPSTYKDGITNNLVNLVGYISLTHATSLNPLSTVVCSASWQQIPQWNHKYINIHVHCHYLCIRIACHQRHAIVI